MEERVGLIYFLPGDVTSSIRGGKLSWKENVRIRKQHLFIIFVFYKNQISKGNEIEHSTINEPLQITKILNFAKKIF